jgi:hypothetical protein
MRAVAAKHELLPKDLRPESMGSEAERVSMSVAPGAGPKAAH